MGHRPTSRMTKHRRTAAIQRFPIAMWLLVGLLLLGLGALGYAIVREDRLRKEDERASRVQVPEHFTRWDPTWPPFPAGGPSPPQSIDTVRAAYAFAAHRADVLHYIPCYCGCGDHDKHRSNLDCYVKERTASGVPTKWDTHAYT